VTIAAPRIVTAEAQAVAAIRLRVTWAEMRQVMRPGLTEIHQVLGQQGVAPAGPWFNHHVRQPSDTLEFAICVPVAAPIQPSGRVEAGMRSAATVIRTVMEGDYAGLGAAWGALRDWAAAQGHTTRADFWECYLVGPETSADPADWRTELNWPVIPG
jgi:effector-binding domain-containing protein